MRWLARMLGFAIWGITKWGAIAVIADGTWTFFKSLSEGLTVTQAMVWAFAAMGAALLLVVGVARFFDYLAGLLPEIVARQKVASLFRDMALHGKHEAITLSGAVHFWMGKTPETYTEIVQSDFKLHHLKAAIGQGKLRGYGPGGSVNESTLCKTADLADYLASWRWILVDDSKWKTATYEGQSE